MPAVDPISKKTISRSKSSSLRLYRRRKGPPSKVDSLDKATKRKMFGLRVVGSTVVKAPDQRGAEVLRDSDLSPEII